MAAQEGRTVAGVVEGLQTGLVARHIVAVVGARHTDPAAVVVLRTVLAVAVHHTDPVEAHRTGQEEDQEVEHTALAADPTVAVEVELHTGLEVVRHTD